LVLEKVDRLSWARPSIGHQASLGIVTEEVVVDHDDLAIERIESRRGEIEDVAPLTADITELPNQCLARCVIVNAEPERVGEVDRIA